MINQRSVIDRYGLHNKSTLLAEVNYTQRFQLLLIMFLGTGLALSFALSYSFSIQQGRNVGIYYNLQKVGLLSLFTKQLIAAGVGIFCLLCIQKLSRRKIRDMSTWLALLAILAMLLTYLFAPEINGVKRWIRFMGASVQTGDFARVALIVYLSNLLARYSSLTAVIPLKKKQLRRATNRLFVFLLGSILFYGGLLYLQGDFSSLLIFFFIILALIFGSDLHTRWKLLSLVSIAIVFTLIVINDPVRFLRVLAYLNPHTDIQGTQFQVEQSYDLIRNGGLLGSGLGSSMLEVLLLPYFNNDFVFSIILSEFGILGIVMVLGLYWVLCYYCLRICAVLYFTDRFYYFISLACMLNLTISALGHIMVVLGFVPTAGLNLPFYSTGGTSLLATLITFAFLLKSAKRADMIILERNRK